MTKSIVSHQFSKLRPLMFSIAYRMLGSVSDAEDVVQEAALRLHQSARDGTVILNPEAFATTVTTRLAINALRSARRTREEYFGQWLPEPLVDAPDGDPARRIEADEALSTAVLRLLEELSPVERAVFILREVFDYPFSEIAEIVSRTEDNCRQIFRRARKHLDQGRPRFQPSPERAEALVRRFLAALEKGNIEQLEDLLASDVVVYGDGGGRTPSALIPVSGRARVARLLLGLTQHGKSFDMRVELIRANGQTAALYTDARGAILALVTVEFAGDERIASMFNQLNPEKLAHLGATGDLNALLRSITDR